MNNKTKPTLLFSWGNPSRGDDAIGPYIYESLQQETLADVELLTDFQLQIEHAIDLERRERVLFIDASVSALSPFEFSRLQAAEDESYTSHAMSPASLLCVYEKINRQAALPAFMLSVRGYEFDLGLPLSEKAKANMNQAINFIQQLVSRSTEDWNKLAEP